MDDKRFVANNPAVHRLTLGSVVACFTDPATSTPEGWEGTYRPLRTLDFSIDWAVGGGRPFFFHLRSALYHALGSVLVLLLLLRLVPDRPEAAFFGALVFAVHPVQVESVAWITSRADVLLLVTFTGALLAYVSRRGVPTLVLVALALFSKEAAVVFPAAALLTDLVRGRRPAWRTVLLTAVLAAAYTLLWIHMNPQFGHRTVWWGGTYGANLLTMSRGAVHYAGLVLLPVRQLFDFVVPTVSGLDAPAMLGMGLAAGALAAFALGGRRTRFVAGWVLVTLLPTSNLLVRVGIPTAERFLYLPMVGIALGAGLLLSRARFAWVALPCLFLLTFSRAYDWKSTDALFASARRVQATPLALFRDVQDAWSSMHDARLAGDLGEARRLAQATLRSADDLSELCRKVLGSEDPLGGECGWRAADALLELGRYEAALEAARRSVELGSGTIGELLAGEALAELGRVPEALLVIEDAGARVQEDEHERAVLSRLLNRLARRLLEEGEAWKSRNLYRRSWETFPHPVWNREAREVLGTLER